MSPGDGASVSIRELSMNAEESILAQERAGLDRWSAGDPVGYAHSAADDVTYFDDIARGLPPWPGEWSSVFRELGRWRDRS
jgi:hypothetical protein